MEALTPIALRARLAVIALTAAVALRGLSALLMMGRLTGDLGNDENVLQLERQLPWVNTIAYFITGIFVCLWLYGATQHALARGASLFVKTPAAAVGFCLIPLLNFVVPFSILGGIAVSARQSEAPIKRWQGLWVVGQLIGYFATVSNVIQVASDLLLVGAGIVGAQVISRLKWSESR